MKAFIVERAFATDTHPAPPPSSRYATKIQSRQQDLQQQTGPLDQSMAGVFAPNESGPLPVARPLKSQNSHSRKVHHWKPAFKVGDRVTIKGHLFVLVSITKRGLVFRQG